MSIFSRWCRKKNYDKNLFKHFRPGTGVDVVLEIGDGRYDIRSAMIYDINYFSGTISISQTRPAITPNTMYNKMQISVLSRDKAGYGQRLGMPCQIEGFIQNYKMGTGAKETIIRISFFSPVQKINLRETYRFLPDERHELKAEISINGNVYNSGKDFGFANISCQGTGFMVPNNGRFVQNSLMLNSVKDELDVEITLYDSGADIKRRTFNEKLRIMWKKTAFDKPYSYIGARFLKLARETDEILARYIHNGQVFRIRKKNAYL